MILIPEWQKIVHQRNIEKGFYEGNNATNIDRKILLAVGELIEAQNELRSGHAPTEIYFPSLSEGAPTDVPGYMYCAEKGTKPEGFGIELADTVIRILDLAEYLKVDLETCMQLKHAYNKTRSYRHGKAF